MLFIKSSYSEIEIATNFEKMHDFKAEFYVFFLCFISFSMREMGLGEVTEYEQKKTPLEKSGGGIFILSLFLRARSIGLQDLSLFVTHY